MTSTKQQIKNVKYWLKRLKTTRMKKGVNHLGNHEIGHCCLGVGCRVFGLDYNPGDSSNYNFIKMVGIRAHNNINIFYINDIQCAYDKSFVNVRKKLIHQAEDIFKPEVAKAVKKIKI